MSNNVGQMTMSELDTSINNSNSAQLKTTAASGINTAGTFSMAAQGTSGWGYPNTNLPNIEV